MAAGSSNTQMLLIAAFGVLVWQKLSGAVDKVGKGLEIGENSGGILQDETTQEINVYESEVKTWHCNWTLLGNRKTAMTAIANKIYTHVKNNSSYLSNIDEDYLIGLLKPLTANELRAVAIQFGVKDFNNFFQMTIFTGHLFHLFDNILTDTTLGGNDLTAMKAIWAKTGLWI